MLPMACCHQIGYRTVCWTLWHTLAFPSGTGFVKHSGRMEIAVASTKSVWQVLIVCSTLFLEGVLPHLGLGKRQRAFWKELARALA